MRQKEQRRNLGRTPFLQEAMNQLPGREYHIIKKRFFEGKTQTEVANEISISQAQVSRLEKNALKSIRNFIEKY